MASTILGSSRPDLRKVGSWLAALAVASAAATLGPTPLQAGFIRAEAKLEAFRAVAPNLAAVLSGKPAQAERLEPELFALTVDDKSAMALGNAAEGMRSEKVAPGSGEARIRQSSILAQDDLGLQWLLVLLQLQNGNRSGFLLQVQGLEASMLSEGWTRLPEASSWLMATATDLQAAGDLEKAEEARNVAGRLDPVSPVPEVSLAFWELRQFHLTNGYSHMENALDRLYAFPLNQQVLVFNTLRLLRYALALSCLLLLLSWVVRYWPYIAHGFAERLPRDTNLYLRYAVLALIPVALLVAGLGLLSMCFLAAFAIWRRARRYERFLIGVILVFVGLQPWLAGLETTLSSRFDLAGPESLYQRAVDEGWSKELDDRLEKASNRATSEEKPILLAASSILQRKQGNYELAMSLARDARRLGADDPRIVANFGNAQFLVGHYDSATRAYETARAGGWGNGPLMYDLGQAIAYRGRTDSMGLLIGNSTPSARYRINLEGDQNTRAFQTLPPNRTVMDPELETNPMWRKVLDDYTSRRWTVDRWDLQTGLIDLPPMIILPFSVIFLVFLLWWGGRPEKRKVLFECRTCGRVMCRHCRKGIHCAQCFRRLSGIEEVDLRNQLLERIEREAHGRRRLLQLAMDLGLPGTGRLMVDPTFGAFLQVFLLGACLSYSLNLPNFLTLYPASETLIGQGVTVGILVVLYALGALQLVRGLGRDATHALKEA
jgi:tetratricopeptide (TPR) repeat protein